MSQFCLILTASAICAAFPPMKIQSAFVGTGILNNAAHSGFEECFVPAYPAKLGYVTSANAMIASKSMSKQLTEEEIEDSRIQKPRLAASEAFTEKSTEARKAERRPTIEEERRRIEQHLLEEREERQQKLEEERPSDAAQQYAARLRELGTLIEMEISAPIATEPKQCKSIAFGSKPCGGPWKYLVYSTARTNEARLKQLVKEFNQLERKLNKERKVISTCEFVTEPKVEFVGGVCIIKDN